MTAKGRIGRVSRSTKYKCIKRSRARGGSLSCYVRCSRAQRTDRPPHATRHHAHVHAPAPAPTLAPAHKHTHHFVITPCAQVVGQWSMSSRYKCPECDATNGIAKSQGRTSFVFHFHVRKNERLQDNITRPGDGTSCRVRLTCRSYSRPGCGCTIGGS